MKINRFPIALVRIGGLAPLLFVAIIAMMPANVAMAQNLSRLQRIEVRPKGALTRISFKFDQPAPCALSVLPGKIRLTFSGSDAPRFKKLRTYSDANISGIVCTLRGDKVQISIPMKHKKPLVRMLNAAPQVVILDVGPETKATDKSRTQSGRERILAGVEKLILELDPPLHTLIPFAPTDKEFLKQLLPEEEVKIFQTGEGYLYKERAAEAVELFKLFIPRGTAVRALASYRLGEALYLLQQYDGAMKAVAEGARLWPQYLEATPLAQLVYADSMFRNGGFDKGRRILAHLIAGSTDKVYVPLLLDRLGDMTRKQGRDNDACNIYRMVAEHYPGTRGETRALMKLADRRIFTVGAEEYEGLLEEYRQIYNKPGDSALRDEALFKMSLVASLYGPEDMALAAVIGYEKRYTKGIFAGVARSMHEELLLPIYQKLLNDKDFKGLIKLAQDNRDYLSRCFSDGAFIQRLSTAFITEKMLGAEMNLFVNLLDREWAAPAAPFMCQRIVDNAVYLGNLPLADITATGFVQRFPRHPYVHRMREYLGGIAFTNNDLKRVVKELNWLSSGKVQPDFPASYYYLGKALAAAADYKGAQKPLAAFIALKHSQGKGAPFLGDAYLVNASCKRAQRDYAGAMACYRDGLAIAEGEAIHQYLYKMAELSMLQKKKEDAKGYWSRIVREGGETLWSKMATQALGDLAWDEKMRGGKSVLSK